MEGISRIQAGNMCHYRPYGVAKFAIKRNEKQLHITPGR